MTSVTVHIAHCITHSYMANSNTGEAYPFCFKCKTIINEIFHSVTEEDVERRNCLAKSCSYSVRNSLLEVLNHSIVSKMRLLTNTPFVHLISLM